MVAAIVAVAGCAGAGIALPGDRHLILVALLAHAASPYCLAHSPAASKRDRVVLHHDRPSVIPPKALHGPAL
uniref:hypothetical protein n=1 Tax=uncultured Rhizobium sp. TaxID=155567 RepID=UPI00262850CB